MSSPGNLSVCKHCYFVRLLVQGVILHWSACGVSPTHAISSSKPCSAVHSVLLKSSIIIITIIKINITIITNININITIITTTSAKFTLHTYTESNPYIEGIKYYAGTNSLGSAYNYPGKVPSP